MIAGSGALRTLESNAKRAHEFALADHKLEMAAYKARETGAKKQAENMAATDLNADIESILKSIGDAPLKPEPQTYIVNTSTVQKLAHICNQNPRGILMFRDEMLAWLSKIDKDEHAEERSFFVMGWNGNSRYIDDTIKHGRIEVDAVCLSVLGGIQPAVLVPYLQRAIASGGGDGLFARFGLLVWPDVPTKVVTCRDAPDRDAQQEVARIFARLDRLDVDQLGASHSGNEVPSLCFSEAAQELLIEWRDAYETSLRESDEDESLKSHLIKYSSLVPRLALVFGLIDEDIDDGKIGMDSLCRALAWTKFLEAHARRAYGAATRSAIGTAKRILGKIQSGEISSPFVARDIYRRRWSGLTDPGTVKAALDLLEVYDWLRGENVSTGGRSSRQYTVNPAAMRGTMKR
jgi:putative DNA primase/helicase